MTYSFLQRFRDDDDGSASIELVLVTPIIVWALLSTLVYFDAFRADTRSTRAGLTIADMFSRELNPVDATYITGAQSLLRTLAESDPNPGLRVTTYMFDAPNDRYLVQWSENRNMGPNLTNDELQNMRHRLPIMANGHRSLLVETRVNYTAPFSLGIPPFANTQLGGVDFNTFTVITPRFVPSVCYDPDPANPAVLELC
jgi:Flp pilus assembly protein TadG